VGARVREILQEFAKLLNIVFRSWQINVSNMQGAPGLVEAQEPSPNVVIHCEDLLFTTLGPEEEVQSANHSLM
jgi:hypothetical protein